VETDVSTARGLIDNLVASGATQARVSSRALHLAANVKKECNCARARSVFAMQANWAGRGLCV
jgi:hypothetical protein